MGAAQHRQSVASALRPLQCQPPIVFRPGPAPCPVARTGSEFAVALLARSSLRDFERRDHRSGDILVLDRIDVLPHSVGGGPNGEGTCKASGST
jgi:hypothetical protein